MGIYHFSPLEAREVGKLCRQHGATIMITTPTFVRSYLRRCEPEDFAKLEVVVTGAEKLAPEVADAFQQKFGVRPVEGYGATELSPVVSANIPPARAIGKQQMGIKAGTVGQPLPGIAAKVVDLDSGADLGPNRSGMLLVAGPNVMKGYYGRPELTAEVIREEKGHHYFSRGRKIRMSPFRWYVTGDVAVIDDEGFITITGRISRFSKLAGEMVPHIRVEEAIGQVLKLDEDDLKVVVTSVPDPKKGERLVVLYTELAQTPEQICRALAAGVLPPLWIPSPDSFRRVDAIPVLGTGKLDLKRVKDVALAEFKPPWALTIDSVVRSGRQFRAEGGFFRGGQRPWRYVCRQGGELTADLGLNVRQLPGQPLHATAIDLRRARQAADEAHGLDEVVVRRLAHQRRDGLADQFGRRGLDRQKAVQAAGDVVAAVGLADIAAFEDQDAAALHRPGQQRPFILPLAIENVHVVTAIHEAELGDRARRLGDLKQVLVDLPQLQPAQSHQLPDVDHHVGMTHQEQIQVRIAIDYLDRHAAKDTDGRQHRFDLRAVFHRELLQGDRADGILAGRLAGAGLQRIGPGRRGVCRPIEPPRQPQQGHGGCQLDGASNGCRRLACRACRDGCTQHPA